jgi:ribosome biogenesis GTPase
VQVGWPEILALAPHCRFNNCLHLREPGCAVTDAVAANRIPPRRYESYKGSSTSFADCRRSTSGADESG